MRKLLQLKLYSFLSSRWGMTFCVVGLFVTLNAFFQIVQLLLNTQPVPLSPEWTDNISGKSSKHIMCTTPVDIVYTWVNGSDPKHIQVVNALKKSMRNPNMPHCNSTQSPESDYCWVDEDTQSRFIDKDNEELRYSLRSLEAFAPWVRRIFIVTNGQIPYWLNLDHPHITIVTHEEIFVNKSHLPTFSSPSIEAHLHRIPNLSSKFIYLNDDVMFGREVYPDDFFTLNAGQKVFLSWPVPNCAEGCPSNWIGDGYCDLACNVSACDFDAHDCDNYTGLSTTGGSNRWWSPGSSSPSYTDSSSRYKNYCAKGCPDSWIGDKYCDRMCKNVECGFDAGDCGTEDVYASMYGVEITWDTSLIELPLGLPSVYFNLSTIVQGDVITDGSHDNSELVRTATISQKHKIMTLTFHRNISLQDVMLSITVGVNQTTSEKTFNITIDTTIIPEPETDPSAPHPPADSADPLPDHSAPQTPADPLADHSAPQAPDPADPVAPAAPAAPVAPVAPALPSETNTPIPADATTAADTNKPTAKDSNSSPDVSPAHETDGPLAADKGNDGPARGAPTDIDKAQMLTEAPAIDKDNDQKLTALIGDKDKDRDRKEDALGADKAHQTAGGGLNEQDGPAIDTEESKTESLEKKTSVDRDAKTGGEKTELFASHNSDVKSDNSDVKSDNSDVKSDNSDVKSEDGIKMEKEKNVQVDKEVMAIQVSDKEVVVIGDENTLVDNRKKNTLNRPNDNTGIDMLNEEAITQNVETLLPAGEKEDTSEASIEKGLEHKSTEKDETQLLTEQRPVNDASKVEKEGGGEGPDQIIAKTKEVSSDPVAPDFQESVNSGRRGVRNLLSIAIDKGNVPRENPRQWEELIARKKAQIQQLEQEKKADEERERLLHINKDYEATLHKSSEVEMKLWPWERQKRLDEVREMHGGGRRLLDMYGDSLKYVNKLYNHAFGPSARKVPAHMPHMIDKGIMEELQARWPDEWDKTSAHSLRSPEDMQYAFAYFYYLIHARIEYNITEIWEKELDVDGDGILNHNELRTLGVLLYGPPLSDETFREFRERLYNVCIQAHPNSVVNDEALDPTSKAPLPPCPVTLDILEACNKTSEDMRKIFSKRLKYKHQLDGTDEVAFLMVGNNRTVMQGKLDGVRQKRHRFICLNDNINHSSPDAGLVVNVLHDFYTSILPKPSSFEHPPHIRNAYGYIEEVRAAKYAATQRRQYTIIICTLSLCSLLCIIYKCYSYASRADRRSRERRATRFLNT